MSKSISFDDQWQTNHEPAMVAHYKDRLSLLVRINALEQTDDGPDNERHANRILRKRLARNGRQPKPGKAKGLLASLRKRLRDLDGD